MISNGGELSLRKIRASGESRTQEEQATEKRKKDLLILITSYLQNHGYLKSADMLQNECGLSTDKFCAADNMDLDLIIQEFENFYDIKFGRMPKLTRKKKASDPLPPKKRASVYRDPQNQVTPPSSKKQSGYNPGFSGSSVAMEGMLRSVGGSSVNFTTGDGRSNKQQPHASTETTNGDLNNTPSDAKGPDLSIGTQRLVPLPAIKKQQTPKNNGKQPNCPSSSENCEEETDQIDQKILRPLSLFLTGENQELAQIISRDIFTSNPNVKWTDITGLEEPKRLLKEAIVYPLMYPELFTGILTPWKGILLYGPPGTGKTMLAKAVATECKTTFFNISSSSIVSKWRGDSEKLVRVLFDLARYHAPSTIFIDELESIMSARAAEGEHEGSRRMKTELLIQMDGLAKSDDQVFVLAASNLPWELDMAMLRRLEKRILINLPEKEARSQMFQHFLPPGQLDRQGNPFIETLDYTKLAEMSERYSGADIYLVCKEAAMMPLRTIFSKLEMSSFSQDEQLDQPLQREPIGMHHLIKALERTKPSGSDTQRYEQWQIEYGSY